PMTTKFSTYLTGITRTQNKCCNTSELPPPLTCNAAPFTTSPVGMKKLVEARRSIICMTTAASNGGNASNNRKAVTNWAQTKNGRRIQVSPGARNWMMVVMKLIAPSSDD